MNIFYGYLFSYLYVVAIILAATILKKIFRNKNNDIFRKIIHISTGFTWLILCEYLYGTWHFVIMPLSFIAVTIVSTKYNLIKIVERSNYAKKLNLARAAGTPPLHAAQILAKAFHLK